MLKEKLFGMMVLLVGIIVVFALVGCENRVDDGGSNPFIGTWHGVDAYGDRMRLVFTSTTWTLTLLDYTDVDSVTGTYTHSGNTGTLYLQGVIAGIGTISGNVLTWRASGIGELFFSR
jgi:uncharacterized lipoprotein NlpE involved in copper resistance